MKRIKQTLSTILLFIIVLSPALYAGQPREVKPVRNVILMIPDGTSLSAVSLARWYQRYLNPDRRHLAIDPYICGTVLTYSSDAPIGDSAPTTSCYMTGMPSNTGFVSTYPVSSDDADLIPVDKARAYSPLATFLEAAKIMKGKKTGLVVTCHFPHATPADCSAHSYSRKKYDWIAAQMVHQNLDVVLGGGTHYLHPELQSVLNSRGYGLFLDDLNGMRTYAGDRMWALFGKREMPYDLDRDTTQIPSLEEMTCLAIEKLNRSEEGFFLMVEGSKVDWAAHANDPVGIATEYLAFDRACAVAFDFARRDGQTAVIIVPDHGNSGVSIGKQSVKDYDKRSAKDLFDQLCRFRLTADGLAGRLADTPADKVQGLVSNICGFELDAKELEALYNCPDYNHSPIPKEQRRQTEESLYSGSLSTFIASLYTKHTSIGFTTHGHTAEEVLLAAYHPQDTRPMGMVINYELNDYLCRLFELGGQLPVLTDKIFAPHTEVFQGMSYSIKDGKKEGELPVLEVKKGSHRLLASPFSNTVIFNKKAIDLFSVVVYVDKTKTFYLPRELRSLFGE